MKHQNYIEHQIEILDKLILLEKQNAALLEALKVLVEHDEWQESDEYMNAIEAIAQTEGKE